MKAKLVNENIESVFKPKDEEEVKNIANNLSSIQISNKIGLALSDGNYEHAENLLKLRKLNLYDHRMLINHYRSLINMLGVEHSESIKNIKKIYLKNLDLILKYKL